MDTTNTNSGEKGGLKPFLEFLVPNLAWIGCGSHKLALCFTHLLPRFDCVKTTDVFLLNLWKFFKYRSLANNVLQEMTDLYGDVGKIVAVCPSTTRWTAHERSCSTFINRYGNFVTALCTLYNERVEQPECIGIIILATNGEIIATVLMLLEVFTAIHPLVLLLQSGTTKLCLNDVPGYVNRSKAAVEVVAAHSLQQEKLPGMKRYC